MGLRYCLLGVSGGSREGPKSNEALRVDQPKIRFPGTVVDEEMELAGRQVGRRHFEVCEGFQQR